MNEIEKELKNIKEMIISNTKRIEALESASREPQSTENKKGLSIKEFYLSKSPKSELEKTITVGYYLEKHNGISPFSTKDLTEGFKMAREPSPSHISDKVYKCVGKGWMMELETNTKGKHKAYSLTNSGEKTVKNNFDRDQRQNK